MMQLLNRLRLGQRLPPRRRMFKERGGRVLIAAAGGVILLVMSVSTLIGHSHHQEQTLAPEINSTVRVPVDGGRVARAASSKSVATLEDRKVAEENTIAHSTHQIEVNDIAEQKQKLAELADGSKVIVESAHQDNSVSTEVSNYQQERNGIHDELLNRESELNESSWNHHDDAADTYIDSSIHAETRENALESSVQESDNATTKEPDTDAVPIDKSSVDTGKLASLIAEGAHNEPHNTAGDAPTTRLYGDGVSTSSEGAQVNADADYLSGVPETGASGVYTIDSEGGSMERLTTRDFGVAFGIAVAHCAVVPVGERAHLANHVVTNDEGYLRLVRTGQLGELVARYADALENAAAGGDESLVYVRNHKLYAARSLPAGTVLGEYGGRYTRSSRDSTREYWWDLPEMTVNGTREAWGIDASEWGNALRFCNDLGPGSWNVAMKYVPWNGHWHVVYETLTPVLENEELSVSFGANYWAARRNAQ